MANSGKNTNACQFYLTLAPAPQCDGKHVVVGRVIDGLEIMTRIGMWLPSRVCSMACCCRCNHGAAMHVGLQAAWMPLDYKGSSVWTNLAAKNAYHAQKHCVVPVRRYFRN